MALLDTEVKKTVKLDGRTFIVKFKEGAPQSVKERKVYAPGKPWEHMADRPYWHHSHKLGGSNTIPVKVIEKAKETL